MSFESELKTANSELKTVPVFTFARELGQDRFALWCR